MLSFSNVFNMILLELNINAMDLWYIVTNNYNGLLNHIQVFKNAQYENSYLCIPSMSAFIIFHWLVCDLPMD